MWWSFGRIVRMQVLPWAIQTVILELSNWIVIVQISENSIGESIEICPQWDRWISLNCHSKKTFLVFFLSVFFGLQKMCFIDFQFTIPKAGSPIIQVPPAQWSWGFGVGFPKNSHGELRKRQGFWIISIRSSFSLAWTFQQESGSSQKKSKSCQTQTCFEENILLCLFVCWKNLEQIDCQVGASWMGVQFADRSMISQRWRPFLKPQNLIGIDPLLLRSWAQKWPKNHFKKHGPGCFRCRHCCVPALQVVRCWQLCLWFCFDWLGLWQEMGVCSWVFHTDFGCIFVGGWDDCEKRFWIAKFSIQWSKYTIYRIS